MQLRKLLAIAIIAGSFSAPSAYGAAYYGYTNPSGDGVWHDVNKSWVGDTMLCWAAAASNIIDWGNWGTGNTADAVFSEFVSHWTDQGSLPGYGWRWWFDGTPTVPGPGWASIDVPGGGNHLDTNTFFSAYHSESSVSNALSAIDIFLHNGFGTTISIYDNNNASGHALTVWGYEYGGTPQDYLGIYFTDSDDGVTALQYSTVAWDGQWWDMTSYGANNMHIGLVEALGVPEIDPASGASALTLLLCSLGLLSKQQRHSVGS